MADILVAIDAIETYVAEGSLSKGLIYDACRVRLIEIGEAVKNIDPNVLAAIPSIRWRAISRMRDRLAHHYFDTDHALVEYVVNEELAPLRAAVVALADIADGFRNISARDKPPTPEVDT
ncbi:MAG TPA: HepT-like ribonuclease domain-containing protein [Acidimicrobiales bacterium]|nr:HepT-like ribonuclease domain-containing protein [Acidimicrobiales bacterium]